jgi:CheY-like chemotaxis protein
LRPLIREDIELRIIPAVKSSVILADVGQVEQVVMNLVLNARDSMTKGGVVVIRTEQVDLDGLFVREHLDVKPGPYVMLSISDTGHGMDDTTKAHIFEPFFTTKGVGQGTGLGLSTVYGIVRQNNGSIWVYSEIGKGTVFKVYFPLAAGIPIPTAASTTLSPLARGTETILLAEDDEQVREVTSGTLRRNGYLVLDAEDAAQALALAGANPGKISLLLTDVVMPKVNGRELATMLLPKRPDLRVLYMSGYTDNVIHHNNVIDPGVVVLEKPFTQDALLRKVRGVLDAVPAQGKA